VASLAYSWDLGGAVNGVRFSRVYGTAGTLRFETNGIVAIQTGRRTRVHFPGLGDLAGYHAMHREFGHAIAKNRPAAYDLGLARRDLRLIEDAYRSSTP
jgi:predicted dehydrogenase